MEFVVSLNVFKCWVTLADGVVDPWVFDVLSMEKESNMLGCCTDAGASETGFLDGDNIPIPSELSPDSGKIGWAVAIGGVGRAGGGVSATECWRC